MKNTSWEIVAKWYDKLVDKSGHYYHKEVIFPALLEAMKLTKKSSILDVGCGSGPFSQIIPDGARYVGVDLSKSLIDAAKARGRKGHKCIHSDATAPLDLKEEPFSHAVCILALQNMREILPVFENVRKVLNGTFYIVLNHPCFRIPRQSSWGVEEQKSLQYRRVDRYMSPLEIPIKMHPGKGSEETLSFHHPLSDYFLALKESGFVVSNVHEWCSNKKSSGKMAKMENRARREFPLFLTIEAVCAESLGI